MTHSALASKTVPHHGKHRGAGPVNRLVLHHWAGTTGGDAHLMNPSHNTPSASYILYADGTLVSQVPEELRPWTTGPTGDAGSVTVETQNSSGAPHWSVSAAAKEKLAALLADLSKRYGWGPLNRTNVRLHSEFMPTACPGPDLTNSIGSIIARANVLRGGSAPKPPAGDVSKYLNREIDIDAWYNYKSANDAAALKNAVRVMPAGRYKVTKIVGKTPHLVKTDGKASGWVHSSVLDGRAIVGTPTGKTHKVVKGDTLWGIAKKYSTTVAALKSKNGLTSDLIKPGQVVKI